MSRYKNALRSVYNGFLPVSQIKGTLIVVVGIYLLFLVFHIKDNLNTRRTISVENVHAHSTILINGTGYPVSELKESALMPIQIDNPIQYFFLSTGSMNESMFSALVKIITGLLLLQLLGQLDLSDPFNPEHYKLVNRIAWLFRLIIVTMYFTGFYTEHWFKATYPNASEFQYTWSFGVFYLIPLVWLLQALNVFYRSAVKTRVEAEFTV